MANPEHLVKLKEGVEAWNKWREENPTVEIDLCEAPLEHANLEGVHLEYADLMTADLGFAHLEYANLDYMHILGEKIMSRFIS
jgi:uncharacterized protein YjbI with pentapeptide repeats